MARISKPCTPCESTVLVHLERQTVDAFLAGLANSFILRPYRGRTFRRKTPWEVHELVDAPTRLERAAPYVEQAGGGRAAFLFLILSTKDARPLSLDYVSTRLAGGEKSSAAVTSVSGQWAGPRGDRRRRRRPPRYRLGKQQQIPTHAALCSGLIVSKSRRSGLSTQRVSRSQIHGAWAVGVDQHIGLGGLAARGTPRPIWPHNSSSAGKPHWQTV